MGPFASEVMFYTRAWPVALVVLQILCIGVWVVRLPREERARLSLPAWLSLAMVILVLFMAVSLLFKASDSNIGLVRMGVLLLQILFAKAIYDLLQMRWATLRPSLIPSMASSAIVVAILLSIYILRIDDAPTFDWGSLGFAGWHFRIPSHVMAGLVPMSLGAAIATTRKSLIPVFMLSSIAGMAIIFWSGARASFLSVTLSIIVASFLLRNRKGLLLTAYLLISGSLGALLSILHAPPNTGYGLARVLSLNFRAGADITTGRLDIWRNSLEIIGAHPWLGIGDGQFSSAYVWQENMSHAHNFLFQYWAQWGLIGGSIAIVFVVALAVRTHQLASRDFDTLLPAWLCTMSTIALGLVDYSFDRFMPFFLLAMMFAWLSSRTQITETLADNSASIKVGESGEIIATQGGEG